MPSTYSTSLRLELQADGENQGTWGSKTNTNLGTLIEQAIAGRTTIDCSGGSVTLTALSGQSDQSRNHVLELINALPSDINIVVPTATKRYTIFNNTSVAHAVTVKTVAGTGIIVPQGTKVDLYCDGTNVVQSANAIVGAATVTNGLTVTAGGLTVTAGALVATAGPLTVSAGGASITGGLTLPTALTVPNGGTGAATLTAHGVLIGAGTSAVAPTSAGTSPQVLTSNGASADPTFQTPALANASDYAEGSWTPTIAGSTTAGTQTYSVQIGRYIRAGNLVTVWGQCVLTAKDGTTAGNIQIAGLPFTATSTSGLLPAAPLTFFAAITLSAGYTQLAGQIGNGGTIIPLQQSGSGQGVLTLPASGLGATSAVAFSGTYRIN